MRRKQEIRHGDREQTELVLSNTVQWRRNNQEKLAMNRFLCELFCKMIIHRSSSFISDKSPTLEAIC